LKASLFTSLLPGRDMMHPRRDLILNVSQFYKGCGVRIVYRQNLKRYRIMFRENVSLLFKASRRVQCRVSAHRLAVAMVRYTNLRVLLTG